MYRALIVLGAILTQIGCTFSEEMGSYKPSEISCEARQRFEKWRREFLKIGDLRLGDGPIAAWGRKVTADIEVWRHSDGKLIYSGPAITYHGMQGDVFIRSNVVEDGMLSLQQTGIILGLNGMAVGGKRRIIVFPRLVCDIPSAVSNEPNPKASCILVSRNRMGGGHIKVRKETLIVEATLTASCIPVFIDIPLIYHGQFRCRDSDVPKRDLGDPIWHFYYALPSNP